MADDAATTTVSLPWPHCRPVLRWRVDYITAATTLSFTAAENAAAAATAASYTPFYSYPFATLLQQRS